MGDVIEQVDLRSLLDAGSVGLTLQDPGANFSPASLGRPAVATPTEGPHRYTIVVPHDEDAVLSVGQGAEHRIPETGITAHTNTHIHLSVRQETPACLSLGGTTSEEGYFVNQFTKGFAVTSTGEAAIWSCGLASLVSNQAGVQISGENEVSIDSHASQVRIEAGENIGATAKGSVNISAGVKADANADFWGIALLGVELADAASDLLSGSTNTAVEVGGFAAGFGDDKANSGNGAKFVDHMVSTHGKKAHKVVAHITTIVGLWAGLKKNWKKMKKGQSKFENATMHGGYILKVIAEAQSLMADFVESAPKKQSSGCINLIATSSVTVSAGKSVSLFGTKTSVDAIKGASMSGLTVAVKGVKESSMSGTFGASVKSMAGDVCLTSDRKQVKVTAKQGVAVTSETEGVIIGGDHDVQLNSKSRQAYVHGKIGAYVGAGAGAGCGLVVHEEEVFLGQLTQADVFANAMVQTSKSHAHFKENKVVVAVGTKSALKLSDKGLSLRSKGPLNIKSDKDNTFIKGKKVLLG